MTHRTRTGIILLMLAQGLAACRGSTTALSPVTPSPVTPPLGGLLSMKGTVSDTAFRHLAGARVEVVDGPQAGLSTTVDANGEFALTGAFDDATQFRATKGGYVTAVRTLQPFCAACNPNRWINFSLEVLAPPVNMAGDYTVTFIADSACATLPNEARTRTYTSTIPSMPIPPNAYINFPAIGALKGSDILSMGVAGDYISFWLETLMEQLAPNTFIAFGGVAGASIGASPGSTIVLPFDGSIDYQGLAVHANCQSKNHRMILTRR